MKRKIWKVFLYLRIPIQLLMYNLSNNNNNNNNNRRRYFKIKDLGSLHRVLLIKIYLEILFNRIRVFSVIF